MLILEPLGGLALGPTLCCGQAFRWQETAPGCWQGVAEGRAVTARQEGDRLVLEGPGAAPSDRAFWEDYFALDLDYPALLRRFSGGNQRLAACVAASPGIRVLRQPYFETLCTFILSQNNNIPRIRGMVERLCTAYGPLLPDGRHAFPSPERLAALTEADLAVLRAGWRAAYLLDAAGKVAAGPLSRAELAPLSTAAARERLMTIRGVGPKVADCTLLYGLGRWEAFPLDVWMKKAMRTLFPRGVPVCCRGQQGIAQQYIFAWARENLPRG